MGPWISVYRCTDGWAVCVRFWRRWHMHVVPA